MIYTSPYTNGEMAQVESTPVLSGDMVIVGASDGTFYAVNRKNGSLMWRHKTGSPILTTVAVSEKLSLVQIFQVTSIVSRLNKA